MIHGGGLEQPIFLTDWQQNQRLMAAVAQPDTVPTEAIAQRSSFELSMFWYGPRWEPYVRDGRLGELEPSMAEQQATFYPASGQLPALFRLGSAPGGMAASWRRITSTGLAILSAAGIPTRVDVR
jgi:hypothetical protein